MFQHLVVPVDGSTPSWAAVPIAARMAAAVDGKLDVVTVVDRLGEVVPARTELVDGVARLGELPVEPEVQVLASDSVGLAISDHLEARTGAIAVMSSHGHGRSAAVLGSTVDELLRRSFGPVIVLGPRIDPAAGALDGTYVVPVDGSPAGEAIASIVEAWTIEFGGVPWLVEVLSEAPPAGADVFESAYPARLAQRMRRESGRDVEYDVLHGDRPAPSIVEFAERMNASLIFASTHGRSGLDRLRLGSVSAEIVRHATCPVVLHRPPHVA